MPSVALLGPQHSFSHEFVSQNFGDHDPVLCCDFGSALDKVRSGEADKAVIPLENSNASTIKSAQYEILARRNNLFITDINLHHVKLDLYSFVPLDEVKSIRSFPPVFAQTSSWLQQNLPEAERIGNFQSTSDAILSLHGDESKCAAIGSQSASFYKVPLIASNIQTEPNVTVFATVEKNRPELSGLSRVLLGIENFEEDDARLLISLLSNRGCAFDSDWVIRHNGESFGVFELKAIYGFSLEAAFRTAEDAQRKCFLLGGYSGKTITRLECEKHSV